VKIELLRSGRSSIVLTASSLRGGVTDVMSADDRPRLIVARLELISPVGVGCWRRSRDPDSSRRPLKRDRRSLPASACLRVTFSVDGERDAGPLEQPYDDDHIGTAIANLYDNRKRLSLLSLSPGSRADATRGKKNCRKSKGRRGY